MKRRELLDHLRASGLAVIGEFRGHAVVWIVRRNRESLIDQRQNAQELCRFGFRVIDADLGLIGLRASAVRMVVNLKHDP